MLYAMVSPFHFSKMLLIKKFSAYGSPLSIVSFHNNQFFFSGISSNTLSTRFFSTLNLKESNSIESLNKSSYAISYLIDKCGISPESAKSVSRRVKFESPERPDHVLKLLSNYGFNQTHFSTIARKTPFLLLCDPEKTLLPKLEFLLSIGLSKADIADVIKINPCLLARSFENQIIPFYEVLKSVLVDDNKVIRVLKLAQWGLHPKEIQPNIAILRELTVPESHIKLLLTTLPFVIMQRRELFLKAVDKVKQLKLDPLKCTFVLALRVFTGKSSKLIWDRCFSTYKKWGWSEEDIMLAFKRHPQCMILSEKKIEKVMDFFVNKMGYESKMISEMPAILLLSLEKRIIPRCSVVQVLSSKGLMKKTSLRTILCPVEKLFLERYVTRYEDQLSNLMSVYRGEVDILTL